MRARAGGQSPTRCKLSGIDPLAWLTDVLQRIVSRRTKNQELHTLLPWNWRPPSTIAAA
jgi:transposase